MEAEVVNRWLHLERWGRLDVRTREIFGSEFEALVDTLWFQQRRIQMLLVSLNLIVAALTGYGAGQELLVCGIIKYETRPFVLSLAGLAVTTLFVASGIACGDVGPQRRLILATGMLSIVVHVYGWLPRIGSWVSSRCWSARLRPDVARIRAEQRHNLIPN
jgi:hypothetical protein